MTEWKSPALEDLPLAIQEAHTKRIALTGIVTLMLGLLLAAALRVSYAQSVRENTPAWSDLSARAHIEPALLKRLLAAQPGERVPMVVVLRAQAGPGPDQAAGRAGRASLVRSAREVAEASQGSIVSYLAAEQSGGRVSDVRPFWIFNGLAMQAAPETAWAVAARPDVALLQLDNYRQWVPDVKPVETAQPAASEWGVQRIHADQVWAAFSITGTGAVVGNMDTGVDFLHPALNANYRGNADKGLYQHVGNWFDATPNATVYPNDAHGHGTHTMGTMAGSGGIGVAPGARWIAARVLNAQGFAYDSWIHAGFEWMLAPGGDASLAPDVLSNSWGNPDGSLATFQPDIARLREAGVVVVFSAGNDGPEAGTVGSPAALPGAFSVGASDAQDRITTFSSRGPSPWNEIKPAVAAPGVNIRSAAPGGAYALMDGTSMAAPHVAGLAALLRSGRPDLSVAETEYAITSTATAIGVPEHNNQAGWGLVDAYRAMQGTAGAGALSGTVRDAASRLPLGFARVTAYNYTTGISTTLTANSEGKYAAGLAAGPYRVAAGAFGYAPDIAPLLTVITGNTTLHDFLPVPLAVGVLRGVLTDTVTGKAATVTVSALNTPIKQGAHGQYQFALPAGAYTVEARGLGYRVMTATVAIAAGHVTQADFGLAPIPRLLLVNSGAWYYRDYTPYYRRALDAGRYSYDLHNISSVPEETPTITDLLKYDVVIWSAPEDSPGFVGAGPALARFLAQGRSLFLSGQDVAFWDGGGTGLFLAPYLRTYLKSDYVSDDAGSRRLAALPDDLMAGLQLDITGGDGANNQQWPDTIALADPDHASQLFTYESGEAGAHKVGACLPYRSVFLSFGFEGISRAAARRDVMQRSLDYFSAPREGRGFSLAAATPTLGVGQPGTPVTFTVRARNAAEVGNRLAFAAAASGSNGPVAVTPSQFTLAPCATATITVQVSLPAGVPGQARNTALLTVRPVTASLPAQTITLTAKTPAPLLVVDDDRWYEVEQAYTRALDQLQVSYDLSNVPDSGGSGVLHGPPAARLAWYPVVLWFTGYDWSQPLVEYDEQQLAAYLDGGGRLLLSSAFYLGNRGESAFARERLGVLSYSYDMTATASYGSPDHPLGSGLGPINLVDPFPRAGFPTLDGALEPSALADTAWRGDHDHAQAIARSDTGDRLVFWGIPLEALPDAARANVLRRSLGWLGPLGDSTAAFDRAAPRSGEPVKLTLALHNNLADTGAAMTASLPGGFLPDPAALPPELRYSAAANVLSWSGPLRAGGHLTFTVAGRARSAPSDARPGSVVFRDSNLGLEYDQPLRLAVEGADLGASRLETVRQHPDGFPAVAMIVHNSGPGAAGSATVTSIAPFESRVVTDSLRLQGPGAVRASPMAVTWQGSLASQETITVTYRLSAPVTSRALNWPVEMLAWDGQGNAWAWRAWPDLRAVQRYFPWAPR